MPDHGNAGLVAVAHRLAENWEVWGHDKRVKWLELMAESIRRSSAQVASGPRITLTSPLAGEGSEYDGNQALDDLLDLMLDDHMLDRHNLLVALLRATLARDLTIATLTRAVAICERGVNSLETPAARWTWNRLKVEVLELARVQMPDDPDILSEQLFALGMCAAAATATSPSSVVMIDWVVQGTLSVLDKITDLAHRAPESPDDWLGSVLMACDEFMAAGCLAQTMKVLRRSATAMAACGPSSSSSLNPGMPSRFRDDIVYLIEMLEGAPPIVSESVPEDL